MLVLFIGSVLARRLTVGFWGVHLFRAPMEIEEQGPVQMISYASGTEAGSLRLVKSEQIGKRSVISSCVLFKPQLHKAWCGLYREIYIHPSILHLYCSDSTSSLD